MSDLSEFIADNGEQATGEEARAIRSLQRLARRWPKTLKLISMDGSLHVIHTDSEGLPEYGEDREVRQACILADIRGIPNDGGSW